MLAIVAMTGRCPDSSCCMVFTTVQLLAFRCSLQWLLVRCFFLGGGLRAAACVITHLSAYRSGGQCNYSMGHHKKKRIYFAACSMLWRSC